MACTGVPLIELHVLSSTRTSGGYFRPTEVRFRGILALSGDYFLYIYKICKMRYHFRPYGPDFKIYIFRNGGQHTTTWLKQNLCLFLSSKNCLQAPCDNIFLLALYIFLKHSSTGSNLTIEFFDCESHSFTLT